MSILSSQTRSVQWSKVYKDTPFSLYPSATYPVKEGEGDFLCSVEACKGVQRHAATLFLPLHMRCLKHSFLLFAQ
jgi:hypothetical protein